MQPIVRSRPWSTLFLAALAMLAAWAWLSDFITMQGESTIYTVACTGGEWKGEHCTGRLQASDPYRFRALPRRSEVLFWTVGKPEPSGRFMQCRIQDGRNWTCPPNAEASRTIALAMVAGRAVHDATGTTRPFRAVRKWRWLLLKWGVSAGGAADY
jgi:hypothetical protein